MRSRAVGQVRVPDAALLAAILVGAIWIGLVAFGSDGLFTLDELIYVTAIHAIEANFSIFIDNGYERFGSDALRLWVLVAGPNGLAPQYPSGYPALAAPPFAVLGHRGVMLLNTAAAIGTLYACYRLAMCLFDDRAVARGAVLILALASFLGDYAVGIWPHALSALVASAATLLTVEAVLGGADGRREQLLAFSAGLVIGIGLLVRVDAVLIMPPLLIWVLVAAPRPLHLIPAAGLGASPGFAVSAYLNHLKFGTYSPLSYGSRGGGTDLSTYAGLVALMAVAAVGAYLLRSAALRRRAAGPGLICLAAAILVVLVVPAFRDTVTAYLRGLYALLVDLRQTSDPRPWIIGSDDGSVTFWGVPKKALGQSLPWLGLLPVLALRRWSPRERTGIALLALTVALWILPFARIGWHGGLSSNLRYFLPIVPHLAILAAVAWRRTEAEVASSVSFATILLACALPVALVLFSISFLSKNQWIYLAEYIFPIFVLCALFLAALAGSIERCRQFAGVACRVLFAFGLSYASMLGGVDLAANQIVRGKDAALTTAARNEIPASSLIYAEKAELFAFHVERDGLLAMPPRHGPKFDGALVRSALESGLRVFVQGDALAALTDFRMSPLIEADGGDTIREIIGDSAHVPGRDRAAGRPAHRPPER